LTRGWPTAAVQRCCVHKLRNLQAKALAHARAEVTADFHRIVYAEHGSAARAASGRFERTWAKRCPGVVRSLQEGGDELLTVFDFPREQWKTPRPAGCQTPRRRVFPFRKIGQDAAISCRDTLHIAC
jgi:transposase-like protein